MLRKLVCGVFALLLCVGVLYAAELHGKIKKVDADKGAITVTVDGKDVVFPVDKDTKFMAATGKELPDGVRSKELIEGAEVTITTEKREGKDHVAKIALAKPKGEK
jgi:hypothetical protein